MGDTFNSQNKIILGHMQMYGGITSIEAFKKYGITRLSGRIFDLRMRGHDIETIRRTGKNRNGHTVNYAEYILKT